MRPVECWFRYDCNYDDCFWCCKYDNGEVACVDALSCPEDPAQIKEYIPCEED